MPAQIKPSIAKGIVSGIMRGKKNKATAKLPIIQERIPKNL